MDKIILLEVRRQVAHFCFGTTLALLLFLDWIDAWFLAGANLVFLALIVYWKAACGERCPLKKMLSFFERKEHIFRFPGRGMFFFLLSSLLVVILFPKNIALSGILILAIGDSLSHLYGRFLGKIKIPLCKEKNVEGHILGALCGALISSTFVPFFPALVAATLGMIVEIPSWRIGKMSLDDNLLIPLVAGGTLYVWNLFFPFLTSSGMPLLN